jgi:hypothetical protein
MLGRLEPCINAGVFGAPFWAWPAMEESLVGLRQRSVSFAINRTTANASTVSVVAMTLVMAVVDFHFWHVVVIMMVRSTSLSGCCTLM